ncbi:hypothetical protein EV284_3452 [Streptomyces sp. BK022]|uniref:hypothetical protein n=1 Tax=Streptomyces sp. BK022 TaxID=2512123 RepID=UPI00102A8F93|nr:hypothetical protein [Streptomyces sp. BK022]RZU35969.1 hypothetical protein EV284_3452 [Streptomyces sp. BK022]
MADMLKKSQKQERRGAELLGGTVNAGSGNGWVRKNDVRTPEYSVEYKVTGKKQYSLKDAELQTAEKQALLDGREMLFGIQMESGRNWIVMSEETFLTLNTQAFPDADPDEVLSW